MAVPRNIEELIERFDQNREAYLSGTYNETQLRHEFVDPFFIALGWDVSNNEGRAYINPDQYFGGLPPEVWEFHIGGYQVCEKWLKDRKGRMPSYDDLTHYQYIISALKETISLMDKIDKTIDKHGGRPVAF